MTRNKKDLFPTNLGLIATDSVIREMHRVSSLLGKHEMFSASTQLATMFNRSDMIKNLSTLVTWSDSFHSLGLQRFSEAFKAARLSVDTMSGLSKVINDLKIVIPDSWLDRHFRQMRDLERMISHMSLGESITRLPTEIFSDTVASIKATLDTYSVPPVLFQEALRLPEAYLSFSKRQFQKIVVYESSDEDDERNVASTILDYAGDMFMECNALFGSGLQQSKEYSEESVPLVVPRYNVFSLLNQHLAPLYASKTADIERAIETSLPAQIHTLGCTLLHLVYQINSFLQGSDVHEVFSPTVRTQLSFLAIPSQVATDARQFAEIVDHLYFLLYEGSGGHNNRLVPLSNDLELAPLWRVKHLRLFFRHDVEHGKEQEIAKKLKQTGQAFEALIGLPRAYRTNHWKNAQLVLYKQLVYMLNAIFERLVESRQSRG